MAKRSGHTDDRSQRLQQLVEDCLRRVVAGETVLVDEITAANPDLMPELAAELRDVERIAQAKRAANLNETARPARRPNPPAPNRQRLRPAAAPDKRSSAS